MAEPRFPILFITASRIGDAVLSSGLLSRLVEEAPTARFTIVAGPVAAPLFRDTPRLERLIVLEKRRYGLHWLGLWRQVRGRRWGLVLDMRGSGLAGLLRARRRAIRRPLHAGVEPMHKVLEAARLLRLDHDPPAPHLFTSPQTEAQADKLLSGGGDGPILAIAPAANWVGKAWPGDRFAVAVSQLLSTPQLAGGRVLLLGGEADRWAAEDVRRATPRGRLIDAVGRTDLLVAYAALRRVRLFIGNDSGLMHMAAAAGAPTLGLFGPSDDRLYAPWGANAQALRTGRSYQAYKIADPGLNQALAHMSDLPLSWVVEAARDLLARTQASFQTLGEPMAETFDLIVRGGEVVNHAGRGLADVGVRAGRVAAIGDLGQAHAGEVFDARGLTVLPGVIDTQVHFREPGLEWKEDLQTGGRGAVLGGVTAVFEMPNTEPTTTSPAALDDKLARAAGRMDCDHAFYVGGTHENAEQLGAYEQLPGCCGVKVFMGASTGTLLVADDEGVSKVLRHVRRRAAFHSEDEYRLAERRPLARTGDWTSHPEVRDVQSAIQSTERLVRLARAAGARIHVLHVSTAEEAAFLAAHKDVASVEVTPQHLTLAAPEAYERLGAFAQMNPPIREARHREGLWAALASGVVDILGSDHAPHTRAEKARPYPASPSGMPGVQTLVAIMLTHVAQGRLSLERFVDLTSHGPQRVFGLADKGRLAQGLHADMTIVDLKARRTITHAAMATRAGWTPFDGFEAHGWPMATVIRGRVVMRDGEVVAPAGGEAVRFLETLPHSRLSLPSVFLVRQRDPRFTKAGEFNDSSRPSVSSPSGGGGGAADGEGSGIAKKQTEGPSQSLRDSSPEGGADGNRRGIERQPPGRAQV